MQFQCQLLAHDRGNISHDRVLLMKKKRKSKMVNTQKQQLQW